jgi:hypothetical protein
MKLRRMSVSEHPSRCGIPAIRPFALRWRFFALRHSLLVRVSTAVGLRLLAVVLRMTTPPPCLPLLPPGFSRVWFRIQPA